MGTSRPDSLPRRSSIVIGHRLILCPHDGHTVPKGRIPILLGHGRAFGSGLHETTVSCLEVLETLSPLDGARVLDVGTGTGILALGAILLGANRGVAFDNDPDAAANCSANAHLNGVSGRVQVYCGTLEALKPDAVYDLILANLYGDIILAAANSLASSLSQGGSMVLSGVAFEDAFALRKALGNVGLRQMQCRYLDDYVTMVWQKTHHGRFLLEILPLKC